MELKTTQFISPASPNKTPMNRQVRFGKPTDITSLSESRDSYSAGWGNYLKRDAYIYNKKTERQTAEPEDAMVSKPMVDATTSPAEIMEQRRQAILQKEYFRKKIPNNPGSTESFTGRAVLALVHGLINEAAANGYAEGIQKHGILPYLLTHADIEAGRRSFLEKIACVAYNHPQQYLKSVQNGLDQALQDLQRVDLLGTEYRGEAGYVFYCKTDAGRRHFGERVLADAENDETAVNITETPEEARIRKLGYLRVLTRNYGESTGWQLLKQVQDLDNSRSWLSRLVYTGISEAFIRTQLDVPPDQVTAVLADLKAKKLLVPVSKKNDRLQLSIDGVASLKHGNPLELKQETIPMLLEIIEDEIEALQQTQDRIKADYAAFEEQTLQSLSGYQTMVARQESEKQQAWALLQEADVKTDAEEQTALKKQAALHAATASQLEIKIRLQGAVVDRLPLDIQEGRKNLQKTLEAIEAQMNQLTGTHAKIQRVALDKNIQDAVAQLESIRALGVAGLGRESLVHAVDMQYYPGAKSAEEVAVAVTADKFYQASLEKLQAERLLGSLRQEMTTGGEKASPLDTLLAEVQRSRVATAQPGVREATGSSSEG